MESLKEFLVREMAKNDEIFDDFVMLNVNSYKNWKGELIDINTPVDTGYGSPNLPEFIGWTEDYIYFPVVYDGLEYIGSVPRNPVKGFYKEHLGGW